MRFQMEIFERRRLLRRDRYYAYGEGMKEGEGRKTEDFESVFGGKKKK